MFFLTLITGVSKVSWLAVALDDSALLQHARGAINTGVLGGITCHHNLTTVATKLTLRANTDEAIRSVHTGS